MTERTLGEFRCACIRRFLATAKLTVLATFLTIGLFPAAANTHPKLQAQIPDKELSAHEQRLFDLLEKKGYEIKPTKVGYDENLKENPTVTVAGEYIWQVSRPYYGQFYYDWKDANEQVHTSNLLDRATDHNQMIALLREVYTNPLIPGFRRDMSWDKLDDGKSGVKNEYDEFKIKNLFDGATGEPKKDKDGNYEYEDEEETKLVYENNAKAYREKNVTVAYDHCNYGLFRDDEFWKDPVIKPFNGATALLIELNDDFYSGRNGEELNAENLFTSYQKAYNEGRTPPDRALEALKYISAIRVIPLQFYVSPESSDHPGFLFNINVSLSKCFVVTKGVNRPYKAYTHREQINDTNGKKTTLGAGAKETFDPFAENPSTKPFEVDAGSVFYNMFEEFSPTNSGPMFDAYKDMSTGKIFEVDHNCSSVIGQEHDIIFGSESAHTQIYNVNLMFFLPDKRFQGITDKQAGDTRIYSCYTFYPPGNRPYFFFNRIYAEIDDKILPEIDPRIVDTAKGEKVELNNHALVPLHWESLYKTIINQDEEESFLIYRMTDGEMARVPIPWNEIVIRDEDGKTYVPSVEDLEIGELWRKIGSHVKVYVIEDNLRERSGESVKYVVHGIRAGSDFEAVESNIVIGFLPNLENGLTIRLSQVASLYHERTNNYINEIQLVNTGYDSRNEVKDDQAAGNLSFYDILQGDFYRKEDNSYQLPNFINATLQLVRYADKNEEPEVVMECNLRNPEKAKLSVNAWNDDYALVINLEFTPRNATNYNREIFTRDVNIKRTKWENMQEITNTIKGACNYSIFEKYNGLCNFRPLDGNKDLMALFEDRFTQDITGHFPTEYTYRLRIMPNPESSGISPLAIEKMVESNKAVVQVPDRAYRVGYEGFTYDQISNDTDYLNRLQTNRPGVAFTVANNPFVAEYEFRCTSHHRALARVERYPGGVFRPFLVENEIKTEATEGGNQEVKYRELPRTAESFTGELSMLLDHWVDPGDEMTLVLHFRESEENAYTNGNSYGFPLQVMPVIPNVQQVGFNAGYSEYNSKEEDGDEKIYHFYKIHITDYYLTQPDFRFAGYSIWTKGESNDGVVGVYKNAYHNADMAYYEHDKELLFQSTFGTSHLPGNKDLKVTLYSPTTMYSEIKNPENVIPAYNPLGTADVPSVQAGSLYTGRYVVSLSDEVKKELSREDAVVTGIDGVETEESMTEYYNLQGIRVPEGHLTRGIYIRRTGNKTEKVLIP